MAEPDPSGFVGDRARQALGRVFLRASHDVVSTCRALLWGAVTIFPPAKLEARTRWSATNAQSRVGGGLRLQVLAIEKGLERGCDRDELAMVPPKDSLGERRASLFSASTLGAAFRQARSDAGLDDDQPRMLRPHDLRHRFATKRMAQWYREKIDVQARLPVLAVYLGHVRYSDTAYYITGTAELLGIVAARVFDRSGVR